MSTPTDDPRTTNAQTAQTPAESARDRFGGIKAGCAFFGWLCAMGMLVLISAVLAAAGLGTGVVDQDTSDSADVASSTSLTSDQIGWVGVGVVIAVILVSYYAGGYVAGRMARFDGARQGVAVIVWTVVVAIVLAVVAAVAGSEYDVLDDLRSSLQIPSVDDLSPEAIALVAGGVVAAIVGAVVGGLAGMRFHRRVDRAALVA